MLTISPNCRRSTPTRTSALTHLKDSRGPGQAVCSSHGLVRMSRGVGRRLATLGAADLGIQLKARWDAGREVSRKSPWRGAKKCQAARNAADPPGISRFPPARGGPRLGQIEA